MTVPRLFATIALAAILGAAGSVRAEFPGLSNPPKVATGLPPELEERIDDWGRQAMRLIYEGRPAEAARIVGHMKDAAPEDPRPYLFHARVLRENVSDQNFVRESLKPQLAPIHFELDRCIELAEAILREDPESLHGLLYRGWGKLFKAQLHALAFEHWSAGRTAKAGKKDLDVVLARDPTNDDAIMVIGTYMYFADSLPRVLRLASLLLRIPGGDRTRGLEWLERAGTGDGTTRDDARGMRGGALFGFEGALEEALPIFEELSRDYPHNPRLLEPVALLELFFAERTGAALPRMRAAVAIGEASTDSRIQNLGARVRFYEALTEILAGELDLARENLETLHAERPEEPDWLAADIYRNLADLYLLLGEGAKAKALHAELDPNGGRDEVIESLLRFLREEEGGPAAAVAGASEVELLRAVQPAAKALFGRDLPEASRILDSLPSESAIVAFYRAELEALSGRPSEAVSHYRKLDRNDLPERLRLFRYVARLRMAEAFASSGDYERAAEVLQRAIESFELRDLMRHVTKARRRYFEHQREGDGARRGAALSRGSRISAP